jgi:hypothetical protein
MSASLLDLDAAPAAESAATAAAERLRITTAAVRVSFCWLGVRKTLTPEQKSQAAESFGAEGEFLSARKKLLDTRHPAYKEVTAVRGQVLTYWKATTLPYPEPGVRLIRQDQVQAFNDRLVRYRDQLARAVDTLDNHYAELKRTAQRRLGTLYNAADYPPSLRGWFGIDWDFPSVEPPDYLLQLSPALYEQERARVAARFEEAVQLAEQTFLGELGKLVSHLTGRLSGTADGEKKIFRDSAISNLTEFFDRFRQLNVRSNSQLDALVEQARQIVQGHEPQALRDNESLRQHVTTQLAGVQSVIDGLMVDRPRRSILRARSAANGGKGGSDGTLH